MPRIELDAGQVTVAYDWKQGDVLSTGVLISRFPSYRPGEDEDNDEVLIAGSSAELMDLAESIAQLAAEVADG